jgi:alpha-mannosidase
MISITQIDHLLSMLRTRIFEPVGAPLELEFCKTVSEDRGAVLAGQSFDWVPVGPDTVWGESQSYFWFSGKGRVPDKAVGKRLYLLIDAQFGRVMGRSDPQCLVHIDGEIRQGADFNHREVLVFKNARSGQEYDLLIEAGTIEDRRQLGFAIQPAIHHVEAEALYYDLATPLEVARYLPETDQRRGFILNVLRDALAALDLRPGHLDESLLGARKAAVCIYEARDMQTKPTVWVTGHTHIDVAWLWRIRETRQKMARSMATALHLMDEYPDYHFMYNQGLLLAYLEEDYPELSQRIKGHVEGGQFEIEGALWLEPDANITGGESFVRHILKGVHYHRDTYEVDPKVIWLPDTFGYSAAMPQLFANAGMEIFVTHKLSWNDTNKMPYEHFFWQGIDGTTLPTAFLTAQPVTSTSIGTTYCPDMKPTHVMGSWRRYSQKETFDELFLVYGHGDGGGGPTREMLEHIRRMEQGIPGCPKVRHDFMKPYLNRLLGEMDARKGDFPTWVGELYLEFHRGTFTSVAKNKRANRLGEQAMRELEAMASYAAAKGVFEYPGKEIGMLWDILLLNQFHDILPGTSIAEVYEDSDRDYSAFFDGVEKLRSKLAKTLAPQAALLALNPFARPREGLARLPSSGAAAVSVGGKRLPVQALHRADGTVDARVLIANVPPLSATVVRIVEAVDEMPRAELSVSRHAIENDVLRAEFDETGQISSLFDKRANRGLLKSGMAGNRLQAYRDTPSAFDAWEVDPGFEAKSWEIDNLVSVEVVETGPYRAAIRFEWRYEASVIVQVVSLRHGAGQLEFDTYIDWQEHNTLVKAAFPFDVAADEVKAEIQFGHVRRATHRNTSWEQARFEQPMQRWVGLEEPGFGVALLNDCKYGYDAKGTTLRLTLLRSPTWPWAEADQGEHRFRYAIALHDGTADLTALSEDFNMPMLLLEGQSGFENHASLLSIDGDGIVLEAIKQAEDKGGFVVRLWESKGRRVSARLTFDRCIGQIQSANLLEEERSPLPLQGELLVLTFRPFEIKTLYLMVP